MNIIRTTHIGRHEFSDLETRALQKKGLTLDVYTENDEPKARFTAGGKILGEIDLESLSSDQDDIEAKVENARQAKKKVEGK